MVERVLRLVGHPFEVKRVEVRGVNRMNELKIYEKVLGQRDPVVPPFIDLFPTMQHKPYNSPSAGHLGRATSPVKLDGQDLASMQLQALTLDRPNGTFRRRCRRDTRRSRREREPP